MPIYEYACKACDHEFEREQRISEKPVRKCPKCGKLRAKRLISRTSFMLKGGGWYNDLYASSKPKSPSDEKPAAEGEGASKETSEPKEKKAAKPKADKAKGKRAAA